MSEMLHLTLLGPPRVFRNQQPLTAFATAKAEALLFYLAVAGQAAPLSRDTLTALLWGEMAETQARQNLRTVLHDLRRLVGDHLQIERQAVAFNRSSPYWLDVELLRRGLAPGAAEVDLAARQAAVDLYQGEFLSGFHVRQAPDFEAWMLHQREQLHVLVVETLFDLVRAYIQRAEYPSALAANRRLLFLDPWSEPAHRQQMLLLEQTGERSAALAQYATCRRILLAEFGVEPLPETMALYEQIRAGGGQRPRVAEAAPQQTQTSAPASAGSQRTAHPAGKAVERQLSARMPGHHLPQRIELYGRQAELDSLRTWVLNESCRLVGIFGIGGQGKTTLAIAFAHTLAEAAQAHHPADGREAGFTGVLWRSLINAPPLAEVLQEWLAVLAGEEAAALPVRPDQQLGLLLEHLRRQRCLLILDNLESILQSDTHGSYRPGYEAYAELVRRIAEERHRGCLLLTSRERPQELMRLHEGSASVRQLSLAGLPTDAGQQMLRIGGLAGPAGDLDKLVRHYSGNPLGLKLVAETIHSVFAGDIGAFLQAETLVFEDVRTVLDQQFERLPSLERELMLWLAIMREPTPFAVLRDMLGQPTASRPLLEAVRSLLRRSLLERDGASFGLQNVVLEYCSDLLTEAIGRELIGGLSDPLAVPVAASFLNRFALTLAQSKEYVRASQTRLLLQPVAEQVVQAFGSVGAKRRLQEALARLRTTTPSRGYAAANLLHLLLHLEADLRGADCSGLIFRQLSLRCVSLPEANFAGATLIDSVFTEPFGFIYMAAFSPDGRSIAASTSEGAIYIWSSADQQLVRVIQAHQRSIPDLAFARRTTADGATEFLLASAGDDQSVGVWSLDAGAAEPFALRLAHPQQKLLLAVSFHADCRRLATVAENGEVFVWDIDTPAQARLLYHFATQPSRRRLVAFSADGGTMAIGNREGDVQLWDVATGAAGGAVRVSTSSLMALALRGDGGLLATGGKEGRIMIWSLPDGRLQRVIETRVGVHTSLAFNSDGSLLASAHEDRVIRLWSIDAQGNTQLRHTLPGHTHSIWSLHFSPPSAAGGELHTFGERAEDLQLLVSGSTDQSVRVWDTATGHALYTLRGQPRAFGGLAIARAPRPDETVADAATVSGWLLAAAGFDHLVHLWQGYSAQVGAPRRSLRGQRGPLYSVALSDDGRLVAGAGADRTVCVWDSRSGELLQTCYGHTNGILSVVFQPGGALLASGDIDGRVLLWRIDGLTQPSRQAGGGGATQTPLAKLQANTHRVHKLAFSPDGRLLAVCGTGRAIRLWDTAQPHVPELIEAQRTAEEPDEQDGFSVAFSPDGAILASGGNQLIHLWDVRQRERAAPPRLLRQHTSWVLALAFSPDGAALVSGGSDGAVCLWDVATGALRAVLSGHTETIYDVACSPDGSAIFSCSYDGTLKVWDRQTGALVATLEIERSYQRRAALVATLEIERPYAGMNISGVTGITEAQRTVLKALGAVEA